ncbi:putative type II methylase domain protein [Helicobacter pylori NQ4044]|uniref:Putative type II methylase domain protein n=1 Tax=Helicobacter pylori NQ4044 TaxID=992028 RepID=J0J371_HELPX|nr:putative type II methylase domain protein [Helicobacter pylori NQ4044]
MERFNLKNRRYIGSKTKLIEWVFGNLIKDSFVAIMLIFIAFLL